MRPLLSCLYLATSLLLVSCSGSRTAIIVEFDILGPEADRATQLEVLVSCEPSNGNQELMDYDLSLLGRGTTPSLAVEPGDEPCDMYLAAQVRGEDTFPLAAADVHLAFEEGSVQVVKLTLDTSRCEDIDGDEAVSGAGCDTATDCDELDGSVFLGALEVCNSLDDDCNGDVDDLNLAALERACSNEPVPWRPDTGICRYWHPLCREGTILCPELDEHDDCRLQMDTNCDGKLTGCGCNDAMLESYDDCEPCHLPLCGDDGIVCVQDEGAPLIGSCCSTDGISGAWLCDPSTEQVACLPAPPSPEVCNDPDRVDEDCDGEINRDDRDCWFSIAGEASCPEVELPPAGSPNVDVPPGCDDASFQAYAAEECVLVDEFTGQTATGVFVILYSDPFVYFANPVVVNCCNCNVDVRSFWDVSILVVRGLDSRGRIYVDGNDLQFRFDVWIGDWAVYQDVRVSVPIRRGDAPNPTDADEACVSNCFEESRSQVEPGGGG